MTRTRHYVSLIVNRPGDDHTDELIDQARPWFGPIPLAVEDQHVEVYRRDRLDRPIEWKLTGWVVEAMDIAA